MGLGGCGDGHGAPRDKRGGEVGARPRLLHPIWFFHSKPLVVTHAVKILPSLGNHKLKMRLDSCAPRGTWGGWRRHPREGAGDTPG